MVFTDNYFKKFQPPFFAIKHIKMPVYKNQFSNYNFPKYFHSTISDYYKIEMQKNVKPRKLFSCE